MHEAKCAEARATSGFHKGLNPTTTLWVQFIIVGLIVFAAIWTEQAGEVFGALRGFMVTSLRWYFLIIVAGFLLFVLWLLLSPYGSLRLGADDEKPAFGYFSWISMLFGAGMGVGLMVWSIAEPIFHFGGSPFLAPGEAGTAGAAESALLITFFHWGLHPWAIYVVVGLTLAFFAYRKGLPLTIRSALYPLIGERIYGPLGHAADILAIFGTVFGVATSLGVGVQQMATGLHELTGWDALVETLPDGKMASTMGANLILIAVITAAATLSVASGLGRGIKVLSELNLWLSLALLAALFLLGPSWDLVTRLLATSGTYLVNAIPLSLFSEANGDEAWQGAWTVIYWGWWISWAPFVGMFIARISRGRTIREFILVVLLVPTLITAIWLTVFGGTGLHLELTAGGIADAVKSELHSTLYVTLEKLAPGLIGTVLAALATILLATYFITSSDSGTLVINTILSLGDEHPPMVHRVVWGVKEGVVAGVLLLIGGLSALQTAAVTAALPFSVIMLFMAWGLTRALREEWRSRQDVERPAAG